MLERWSFGSYDGVGDEKHNVVSLGEISKMFSTQHEFLSIGCYHLTESILWDSQRHELGISLYRIEMLTVFIASLRQDETHYPINKSSLECEVHKTILCFDRHNLMGKFRVVCHPLITSKTHILHLMMQNQWITSSYPSDVSLIIMRDDSRNIPCLH